MRGSLVSGRVGIEECRLRIWGERGHGLNHKIVIIFSCSSGVCCQSLNQVVIAVRNGDQSGLNNHFHGQLWVASPRKLMTRTAWLCSCNVLRASMSSDVVNRLSRDDWLAVANHLTTSVQSSLDTYLIKPDFKRTPQNWHQGPTFQKHFRIKINQFDNTKF